MELSAAGLALECSQWLDGMSQQLRQLEGRLLLPCTSVQDLLIVEAAVQEAMEGWQYLLLAAPPAGADEATGGTKPGVAMSWNDVCQWVLARPCLLWPLLFEQPLLARAKELVSSDFRAVVDDAASLLDAAMQVGHGCILGRLPCCHA